MQLKFTVVNQRIARIDTEKPVAGSVGYLNALFSFSTDWEGLIKTAIFRAGSDAPYEVLIADDGTCDVATQAIIAGTMYVSVRGDSANGDVIFLPTLAWGVPIAAAGAVSGETPEDPTPDVYAQILRAYTAPFPGDNGNWWYYDNVTGEFVDSGYFIDLTISTAARDEAVAAAGEAEESAAAALLSEQNAKTSETVAGEKAVISTTQAGISTDKANSASLNKDATDENKTATDGFKEIAVQKAGVATEQALLAEYYAGLAASLISSIPTRYYRVDEAGMFAIQNPIQGDLCYITDYVKAESQLFVYDTVDMDEDEISPEWVFLGFLNFASLEKSTLLDILELAAVAISGSYTDLINKPNRYESFLSLATGAWDYSLSDKAVITLTADTILTLTNVYNGAVGTLIVYGAFTLTMPVNSKYAYDYNYLDALIGEYFMYTFIYDGSNYHWNRTVCEA